MPHLLVIKKDSRIFGGQNKSRKLEVKKRHAPQPNTLFANFRLSNLRNKKILSKKFQFFKKPGFSKINYIGNTYKKSVNRNTDTPNKNVSPHWRRGHWRNQRYGEKLVEKKLIWIKPVIVNRDIGTPQKGHIYETSKKPAGNNVYKSLGGWQLN